MYYVLTADNPSELVLRVTRMLNAGAGMLTDGRWMMLAPGSSDASYAVPALTYHADQAEAKGSMAPNN